MWLVSISTFNNQVILLLSLCKFVWVQPHNNDKQCVYICKYETDSVTSSSRRQTMLLITFIIFNLINLYTLRSMSLLNCCLSAIFYICFTIDTFFILASSYSLIYIVNQSLGFLCWNWNYYYFISAQRFYYYTIIIFHIILLFFMRYYAIFYLDTLDALL